MVKAAVKAMDAVQEFYEDRPHTINTFVTGGGSKRGWYASRRLGGVCDR